MKNLLLFSLLVFLLTGISQSLHAQQCVNDTNNIYTFFYNGIKYEIVKETKNWKAAAACAVERGGMLTEIDSQQEQDSIFAQVNSAGITAANTVAPDGGNASYLWIGGNDIVTEGEWVWDGNDDGSSAQFWQGTSTGSAVGGRYNNWGGEPDDFSGQDALGFAFTAWPFGNVGEWNDVDQGNRLYFIIEYNTSTGINDPKPESTISLYPNPSRGNIHIELDQIYHQRDGLTIKVYNLAGLLMQQVDVTSMNMELAIKSLVSGMYIVTLENTSRVLAREKMIIKR